MFSRVWQKSIASLFNGRQGTTRGSRRSALQVAPAQIATLESRTLLSAGDLTAEAIPKLSVNGEAFPVAAEARRSKVGVDDAGNFVVLWRAFGSADLYATPYQANGTPSRPAIKVATSVTLGFGLDVAGDGTFSVVWSTYDQVTLESAISVSRYQASGDLIDSRVLDTAVMSDFDHGNRVAAPSVAINDEGATVVVWTRTTSSTDTIHKTFEFPIDDEGGVVSIDDEQDVTIKTAEIKGAVIVGSQETRFDVTDAPAPAYDYGVYFVNGYAEVSDISFGVGGALSIVGDVYRDRAIDDSVLFSEFVDLDTINEHDIWLRNFQVTSTSATARSGRVVVSSDGTWQPTVGVDDNGNALVAWRENGVRGRRFSATGAATSGTFLLDPSTTNSLGPLAVAADGSFAVATASSTLLALRAFHADGTSAAVPLEITSDSHDEEYFDFAINSAGSGAVTWARSGANGSRTVYARRLGGNIIQSVVADFDEAGNGAKTFGTYIEGVPLQNTFGINVIAPLPDTQKLFYRFDGTGGWTSATQSLDPKQYIFTQDVGNLKANQDTHKLEVQLVNLSDGAVLEEWNTDQVLTTKDLQVDFKAAADGESKKRLDKLRFIEEIGVVTDFETSLTKLPLFNEYKDDFDLVLRDSMNKEEVMRRAIVFQKSGSLIFADTENWSTTGQLKNLRSGAEYEAVLSARAKHATTFDREVLNVENLPKWLSGQVTDQPSFYDYTNDRFVIQASYPPQLAQIDLPTPQGLPFGLFDGAESHITAGLRVEVFAGLASDDAVTARLKEFKASITLLGQPVLQETTFPITTANVTSLSNKVKLTHASAITLNTGKIEFARDVNLFSADIGKTKDFSLTQTILSKIGGPASGIIDFDLQVKGVLKKFFGEGQFTITGVDTTTPQFDVTRSFFTVTVGATGELTSSLGGSVKLPSGYVVASSGVTGSVWAKVEGKATVSFGGAVLTPTVKFVPQKSRLAAQFGAKLKVSVKVANYDLVDEPFETKSKVYTLLGSELVPVSLSDPEGFETAGDGIVTAGNVARGSNVSGPVAMPAAAVLAVSTLTFKNPLDSNSGRIQLDYGITSTIKPLATGRHRLEVVAIPYDTSLAETVLGSVDLATLALTADPAGGFRSAAQSLVLNIPPEQLDPRFSQQLVLRLVSDPASGEVVRVQPTEVKVTVAEPTLSMTAANGILNDGAITFGAETNGQTRATLQLSNSAGPLLLVQNLRVEGTNLRVTPAGELDLYGNDLPRPLTVEVINPALPVNGSLQFSTNDPSRPTVSIPVTYAPANTAPTIGGLPANQSVNDSATISPFAAMSVTDPNQQNMLAKVTILNGTVRGDFAPGSVTGWTRSVSGNNIVYSRFYNPAANIGSVVQAALRGFIFVPRSNAIKPNTTELTDIQVFVNDGVANTTATTRITTTSVNNSPTFVGTTANIAVNDNATVNPFTALTVSDVDNQELLISVTILNGTVRGDFTAASTTGWAVRYVLGNNITYKRYFGPQANVGAAAQAAFRALVFQPRQNAIKPGTTEATDFQVTVSDGVAPAVLGTGTRVTTTSINNAPTIAGTVANQTMNDNQTKAVFSTLTITDPDTQDQFVRITITNGTTRGDFTAASTSGWTRKLSGTNILYERFFAAAANNGATVQAAIRALIFQPRNNVPIGTTETTSFTVFVNDGLANSTNSSTSVSTSGVAPRPQAAGLEDPADSLGIRTTTIILPMVSKTQVSSLARLLKRIGRQGP